MKQGKKNIAGTVRELVAPIVSALGYILWDVEYVKEGSEWYLRITIDSPEGISIDDCEKVHRAIDEPLDEADPIEGSYRLEVSSPGIERELKQPQHYTACMGEEVLVSLYAPLEGETFGKQLRGKLYGYENGDVLVETAGRTIRLSKEKLACVRTVYDY